MRWRLEGDEFVMSWIERSGPLVLLPERGGFGSTVVDSRAKLSVGGEVELNYAPSGLMWRLTCPAANAMEPLGMSQISGEGENRSDVDWRFANKSALMLCLARQSNDSEVGQNVRNWPKAADLRSASRRAGFADRSVMEFSGDHFAQRHMHHAPANPGRRLCDFASTRPEPGFPVVPKRSAAFRLSCKRSPNQVIRRPCDATLILDCLGGDPHGVS